MVIDLSDYNCKVTPTRGQPISVKKSVYESNKIRSYETHIYTGLATTANFIIISTLYFFQL